MPLLAPSKDKRLLPVDQETPEVPFASSEEEEKEEGEGEEAAEVQEHKPYLHIALKKE